MDLRISSPCPKSWDDLVGDHRIRYCGQCKLNVYNLAEMSPGEVAEIVQKTEGRLCGRLYQRADQTATVQDCPRSGFRKKLWAAAVAVTAVVLAGLAWSAAGSPRVDRRVYPTWVRTVLRWINPEREMPVGRISCPPPKTPPTLPSTED